MGFRFQKRLRLLPGVWINLSKTGVSASVGGKGATINVGHTGKRMITLGIPGTGMSYRVPLSGTILVALLIVIAVIGLAFLIQPDLVKKALHWWQPKWF
jgi:Protein of unknown function (DUF4236)